MAHPYSIRFITASENCGAERSYHQRAPIGKAEKPVGKQQQKYASATEWQLYRQLGTAPVAGDALKFVAKAWRAGCSAVRTARTGDLR